ncbi:MAG: hypothetical protein ACOYI6_04385 [Christensenellales bacterium]|jgi:hypothetical protein
MGLEDLCLLEQLDKDERENFAKKLVRSYEDYDISIPAYRNVKKELLKRVSGKQVLSND